MLAGQPPFSATTAQAVLVKILTADVPSITSERRTVPPHVGRGAREGVWRSCPPTASRVRRSSERRWRTRASRMRRRPRTSAATTLGAVGCCRPSAAARRGIATGCDPGGAHGAARHVWHSPSAGAGSCDLRPPKGGCPRFGNGPDDRHRPGWRWRVRDLTGRPFDSDGLRTRELMCDP